MFEISDLRFDPVGSTSWPQRHRNAFRQLAELVAAFKTDPTVVIVGPGGVTRLLRPLLHDAATPHRSILHRTVNDLARGADQVLRRLPFLPLVSLEPLEVEHALARPHRLIVVDRSRRVLAAVRRDLPRAECHCLDISTERIPVDGDAVIAFNVISRTANADAAATRLIAAVRPGGLLLIDERSAQRIRPALASFEQVAEKIYRRQRPVQTRNDSFQNGDDARHDDPPLSPLG